MKRKRSNKKGKAKAPSAAKDEAVISIASDSREDDSSTDDDNNEECESGMEVDTEQPLNAANIKPASSADNGAAGKSSVRHVKVKLKTSKALESPTDTDRSSPPLGSEKQGAASDKMEDSGSSVPDVKMSGSGSVGKKPGSIKIMTSKMADGTIVPAKDRRLELKSHKPPRQVSQYNKQELDSALTVIRKIMKMDAAVPFNVPVNPEALGIPDYFDIIDTPMDFGTICNNLERDNKYMNSEDVYTDVQYIWNNCFKYNNKGDYIVDLMRRVKKNFMKYWTAAGLYSGQPGGASGAEGAQEAESLNQGKAKSGQPKQKSKKRHGRRHKSDCLCAVCVLKRRRREREENARQATGQSADEGVSADIKQDGGSPVESPGGEDSSSNIADSPALDTDAEVDGTAQDIKMEESNKQNNSPSEKSRDETEEDEADEEREKQEQAEGGTQIVENSQLDRSGAQLNGQINPQVAKNPGASDAEKEVQHERKRKVLTPSLCLVWLQELVERQEKSRLFDKFRSEDPIVMNLCTKLFPGNSKSMWNGPHSLFRSRDPTPARGSFIHSAIETLMK
ncbi:Bromodomain-containing protein 4B [Linum perenne]